MGWANRVEEPSELLIPVFLLQPHKRQRAASFDPIDQKIPAKARRNQQKRKAPKQRAFALFGMDHGRQPFVPDRDQQNNPDGARKRGKSARNSGKQPVAPARAEHTKQREQQKCAFGERGGLKQRGRQDTAVFHGAPCGRFVPVLPRKRKERTARKAGGENRNDHSRRISIPR